MIKVKLNDKQLNILRDLVNKKNFIEEKYTIATQELNNCISLLIEDDLEKISKLEIVDGNIVYDLLEEVTE